jgi:hypothetical protein
MRSGIPSGDVDASFPSRERTQEYLPPSERISDIEDSNNDDDVVCGICFHAAWFISDNYAYHGDYSRWCYGDSRVTASENSVRWFEASTNSEENLRFFSLYLSLEACTRCLKAYLGSNVVVTNAWELSSCLGERFAKSHLSWFISRGDSCKTLSLFSWSAAKCVWTSAWSSTSSWLSCNARYTFFDRKSVLTSWFNHTF